MLQQRLPLMPNTHQRLQIAVHACVHPRTVLKCYRSKPVRSGVAARVCAAARALLFPEPEIVIAK
jgi:hypothetical protein